MTLASRLAAGETLFTAWSGVPDALTVEIVASQPFDVVTLDMQHGGHHEDSVLRSLVPVLRAGKPAVVRIPVGRFDMASRALDFGAEAVIAPMVNSLADARAFAASMKYPPVGERSWGPTFAMPRLGGTAAEWLAGQNTATLAFAMIETRPAYEALDGILDTPGIDGIFLGPSDFSIALTAGGRVDPAMPEMMDKVADIARRARARDKYCAIYSMEPANAGLFARMGYQLIAIASEHKIVATGSAAVIAEARASLG